MALALTLVQGGFDTPPPPLTPNGPSPINM